MNGPALAALLKNRKARVICGTVFTVVLFGAVCVAGYVQMFNQFALYDDSGTFLLAFDGLTHGRGLYDEVVLPYGPFFYQVFQPVFEVVSPTTNHGRLVVFGLGLCLVVLASLIVWSISRSILLTLASMLLSSMVVFSTLANEPMHPVGLITLLSLGLVATILPGRTRRPLAMGVVAGLVIGGLLMTKVNIGGYALLAIIFAAVAMGRFRGAGTVRQVAAVFFVLLPFLVANRSLGSELGGEKALDLLFLVSIVLVPVLFAGFRLGASLGEDEYRRSREWLKGVPAGMAVTVVVSTVIYLATGGNFADLINGILFVPARLADTFSTPLDLPMEKIQLSVIAAAACFAFIWGTKKYPALESHWLQAVLRIATGCLIWVSLAFVSTDSLDSIVFPAAMAWVVLIPLPGAGGKTLDALPRMVIASFAVIGLLGAFPIAGSQILSAALLFVPVGALCLADGIGQLKLALASPAADQPGVVLVRATVLMLILPFFVSTAAAEAFTYQLNVTTSLPDASRLRLPPEVATQFETLNAAVNAADCTSMVTYPPSGSLVLWSGLARTSPMALSNWQVFLDDEQKDELVNRASQTAHPCLLRSDAATAPGSSVCTPGEQPDRVRNYLCGDAENVTRVGGFELLTDYPPGPDSL